MVGVSGVGLSNKNILKTNILIYGSELNPSLSRVHNSYGTTLCGLYHGFAAVSDGKLEMA